MFFTNVFLFHTYTTRTRNYYDNVLVARNIYLGYSVRWWLTEVDEDRVALCTV